MPPSGQVRQLAPRSALVVLLCIWCLFVHLQLGGLCAESPTPLADSNELERGDEGEAVRSSTPTPEHPIFMLPGVAGSGLMISASNASLPLCSSSPVSFPVPFRLWASLSLVRPPRSHQLCWMDIMQPVADEKGEVYVSKEGLSIEMDFARLKSEIETHVDAMGGSKADVLVHSLGSIVFNYFLNKVVDQQWKDKYINSYTLVAPATGGSFKAIKAILTGYNDPVDLTFWTLLDISLIPVDILRDLSRSLGSIYALLPDIDLYGQDHLVVRQLLPKKAGSFSPAVSALINEGSDSNSQSSMAPDGRTLEFRRLSETSPLAEWGNQTVKTVMEEDRTTEEDGIQSKMQQETEKLVKETTNAQINRRAAQVHRYAAEARERMETVDHLAAEAAGEMDEVIYTLGNWTTLLPPELRVRAETARGHMQGILKDPGVPTRCIWSVFGFPSTDIGYIYTGTDLSRKPIPVLDVGDDTVPLRSLSVCAGWKSTFEVPEHYPVGNFTEKKDSVQISLAKHAQTNEELPLYQKQLWRLLPGESKELPWRLGEQQKKKPQQHQQSLTTDELSFWEKKRRCQEHVADAQGHWTGLPATRGSRGEEGFGSRGEEGFGSRAEEGFGSREEEGFGSRGEEGFGSRGEEGFGSRGEEGFGSREEEGFGSRGEERFVSVHRGGDEGARGAVALGTGVLEGTVRGPCCIETGALLPLAAVAVRLHNAQRTSQCSTVVTLSIHRTGIFQQY
ncbi:1-O-acylceramide synthase, putative [Eimeria brunetti]|uniref:1-O-acylceramide synthase, putative n=1 Tax=Eimeria brunetti TaxID=51314 RepID=U6LTF6_9EIME|nr:1-O-acylceramide synthase, putative [Eimeria brunetti]